MRARLLAAALCLFAAAPAHAAWDMPADTTTRVGSAATFIYNWTAAQYANLGATVRDYIWAAAAPGNPAQTLRFPAGVFQGAYATYGRLPGVGLTIDATRVMHVCGASQDCTYDWVNTNHPSWIVRTYDRATPAWAFNDHDYVPVDISNPAVQLFKWTNEILPLLNYGFSGVSLDNLSTYNLWDQEGVCSAGIPLDGSGNPVGDCASNGGVWTQLYTTCPSGVCPRVDDGAFTANIVSWLEYVSTQAHALGKGVSGNIDYETRSLATKTAADAATKRVIDAVDIWYLESAWTLSHTPSGCLIGGVSYSAALSGTLDAGSTTVTVTGDSSGAYLVDQPVSIVGAGARGKLYLGTVRSNGVYDGGSATTSFTVSPPTGVTVAAGDVNTAGASTAIVGDQWVNLTNFINGLSSNYPAIVQENSICPTGEYNRQVVQFVVGSHLISKPATAARAYLAPFYASTSNPADGVSYDNDGEDGADWPEFSWVHGAAIDAGPVVTAGVYTRRFANGMVLCNPDASGRPPRLFDLGSTTYHGFDNVVFTGNVTLQSPSCLILKYGAPTYPNLIFGNATLATGSILAEDGSHILAEDGSRILLER